MGATNSWPIHCTDVILVEDHEVVVEEGRHFSLTMLSTDGQEYPPMVVVEEERMHPLVLASTPMVGVVEEEGIHHLVDLVPPPFCPGSA